ncbi:MAG TPA: Nif3-like dinuclear metal center hexameric protein [Labilithrix sp.]
MRVEDALRILDSLAPLRYAASWDNVGLLVGDPSAEVARVLVTVDYSGAVADEAVALGASLVVAYHPPLFSAVKRIPHDALWADALRRGIALYSMHTALDCVRGGTNDVLADACGIAVRAPLQPIAESPEEGQGRVGDVVSDSRSRREIIAGLKAAFALDRVMVAGPLDSPARRVAVAAGAGGELLEPAIRAGAELFVTGELRHHDALSAARRGVTTVATLHSNSERAGVRAFAARLATALAPLEVKTSLADADPFVFV